MCALSHPIPFPFPSPLPLSPHLPLPLLPLSPGVVLELTAVVCTLMHYITYAGNGMGAPGPFLFCFFCFFLLLLLPPRRLQGREASSIRTNSPECTLSCRPNPIPASHCCQASLPWVRSCRWHRSSLFFSFLSSWVRATTKYPGETQTPLQ